MRIGVKTGPWGWSFAELERSWEAAEEVGFNILACFDHVTAGPKEAASWDAPALLAAMAARTSRITLAARVLNVCLRHVFLLAGQLAVVQALSGGRLDVGLGAGSFGLARHDHIALTIPFPGIGDRMARLDAACRVLPALWGGERVTDQSLGLSGASLGPIGVASPRLVVGGASERAVAIAARYCEGLNLSTANPDEVTEARRLAERFCFDLGRPAPIAVEAQLWVRDLWPDARSHLQAFEASGAEAVILVLDEQRGANEVRRLADRVL